jgi:hypothetical protein
MRNRFSLLLPLTAILTVCCALAWAQDVPSMPRTVVIARPSDKVFAALKEYFSNSVSNHFELVSVNPASGTIIAKRHGIDENSWTRWAFCKTQSVNMLDTLSDGSVSIKVNVQPSGTSQSRVTVAPDFKGYYTLGNTQDVLSCQSKGALEDDIVAAAGPLAPSTP